MRVYKNGRYREMTLEEVAAIEAARNEQERQYWQNTPYGEAVDAEIRKRYSVSHEFAILRQQADKPEEYAEYYAYCEACKAYVREKKTAYSEE